jgi:hypothetical protein
MTRRDQGFHVVKFSHHILNGRLPLHANPVLWHSRLVLGLWRWQPVSWHDSRPQ